MAGTMAWSIADARWILGRDELTSFVLWIGLAAVMAYMSSRVAVAPWVAQVIGAAVGAFVLIEVVGSAVPLQPGATPGLTGWFQATANSVAQAYLDLAWRHQISTTQYGHFCLIIGIVSGDRPGRRIRRLRVPHAVNGVCRWRSSCWRTWRSRNMTIPALVLFTRTSLASAPFDCIREVENAYSQERRAGDSLLQFGAEGAGGQGRCVRLEMQRYPPPP